MRLTSRWLLIGSGRRRRLSLGFHQGPQHQVQLVEDALEALVLLLDAVLVGAQRDGHAAQISQTLAHT